MEEPPLKVRLGLAIALSLMIIVRPVYAHPARITVFYYGLGDGYLGKRHAASWHGKTPAGWPEVVDLEHPGIATNDLTIPFGTPLCLEITAIPGWAQGEYDWLIGRRACGIVVDRMPRWTQIHFGPALDLWPALARKLMGQDFKRIGTVTVRLLVLPPARRKGYRR